MKDSFITVKDGIITGKHHGNIKYDLKDTPFKDHKKIAISFETVIKPHEPVTYYTKDWKRKTDKQLIEEKLLVMPDDHVMEGDMMRPMTNEERVIAGVDEPEPGYKIADGKIVSMTNEELLKAGLLTQEAYNERVSAENIDELNRLLAELQTPEVLAEAEIDEDYALERKEKLKTLLAVKKQKGWPLSVEWPELINNQQGNDND